ncbi:unnamed protein product [Clonostachys chloroleuca]|uniref:Uncharacterized protein n=1 Tax=Clonostachys chloroleuca TaxID=1926264 RepID=A0AA35Q868_9HYPO|nr:unnamed protein product [Clonostachys chloroleuca]
MAGPAPSPADAAVLVDEVGVPDLAVEQADGLADLVGHDGGSAGEDRGGVLGLLGRLLDRLADEIGEEEGELGFEEAGRRNEGLALVELEIAPIAEVRPRELCSSVQTISFCRSFQTLARYRFLQFLSPYEMLVIVHKVVPTLAEGPAVNTTVFTSTRRVLHSDGPGQRFWCELALDALAVAPRRLNGCPLDFALGIERRTGGGLRIMADGGCSEGAPVLAEEAHDRTLHHDIRSQGRAEPPGRRDNMAHIGLVSAGLAETGSGQCRRGNGFVSVPGSRPKMFAR